jgi:hypothetical protein
LTEAVQNQELVTNLRKCTKCLDKFEPSQFYSKGNRLDSICKSCKKAKRRSTYVVKQAQSNFAKIIKILDVIYEREFHFLEEQLKKLSKIWNRSQQNLIAA